MHALNDVSYFDSFGVEHIPKEIENLLRDYTFRIQVYDSMMFGYLCVGFIDFMLKGKSLTDFTDLFSSNNFKKNDFIILHYFMPKF